MQTPTSNTEQGTQTNSAPDLSELSFSDYQSVRRGGSVPEKESKSAPVSQQSETEQKIHSESDTEDQEAHGESEVELSQDTEAKESEKAKPKNKGGFQKRINKLTSEKSDALREAEYWKKEALKYQQSQPKTDAEPKAPQAAKASEDGKPNPENFDSHQEYVEALADWKVEQKLKAREEKEQKAKLQSEQEKLIASHSNRVKAFAEKNEDFQDALDSVDDIPVPFAVQQIFVTSENGPELMYELAKNRDELERICKLGPIDAARELGRIEAKMNATRAPATEEKQQESKKLTNAPKPIAPVGAGKGTVAKSIEDPNLPFTEYVRIRREQMKRRGA